MVVTRRPPALFSSALLYFQFRLQPELLIPADRATVLLPEFVSTHSNFFLCPLGITALLQPLLQLLDPCGQALNSRGVVYPGSYWLACSILRSSSRGSSLCSIADPPYPREIGSGLKDSRWNGSGRLNASAVALACAPANSAAALLLKELCSRQAVQAHWPCRYRCRSRRSRCWVSEAWRAGLCPELGVKPTCGLSVGTSRFDPQRTLATSMSAM